MMYMHIIASHNKTISRFKYLMRNVDKTIARISHRLQFLFIKRLIILNIYVF